MPDFTRAAASSAVIVFAPPIARRIATPVKRPHRPARSTADRVSAYAQKVKGPTTEAGGRSSPSGADTAVANSRPYPSPRAAGRGRVRGLGAKRRACARAQSGFAGVSDTPTPSPSLSPTLRLGRRILD